MKKFILLLSALSVVAMSSSYAQKVNKEAEVEKLAKADAEAEHPKKGIKAAAWIKRGDAYVAAIKLPTKELFVGLTTPILEAAAGKGGKKDSKSVGSRTYQTTAYPYFIVYVENGSVSAWTLTNNLIDPKASDKAIESYQKAVELEPDTKAAVTNKLMELANYYKEIGSMAAQLGMYKQCADAYTKATNIQKLELCNAVDPQLLFLAGYFLTIDGETTAQSYVRGENILKQAIAAGYNDIEDKNTEIVANERGNIYYYGFHCAYAQREKTPNKIKDAKKWLIDGVAKYPMNERIFEGLLMLYTSNKDIGDPTELLPTIEKSIAANRDDEMAWFGRGRIYNAVKNYDECVKSFQEVVRINPTSFEGNYYLGAFITFQSDEYSDTINGATYTDEKKYNADIAKLNSMYARAVAPFEAAHAANPKDRSTLEYLKSICFRLRYESDEMMKKADKYKKLYDEL
ncbi:MAG: tetratricopeptide repeat protein [Rikenellaceae bacterium]